jgi:hypothetical protein
MLDLQPRVHLHEPEAVGRSPSEPSTMNSTVPAPHSRSALAARTAASPMAARISGGHAGGRRLLDHLLVAALQRAVALEQVDRIAVVAVAEHLHLDMARVCRRISRSAPGRRRRRPWPRAARRPARRRNPRRIDAAHALAAAARHAP